MEKNTYVAIFDFIFFVVDETLDLYHEWALFESKGIACEEELSERKEIFLDELTHCGRLKIPSDSEVVPDRLDTYFAFDHIPSPEDMTTLKVALGDTYESLSVRDRELLATGYKQQVFVKAGWTIDVYTKWLMDPSITLEDKKFTIFHSIIETKRLQNIALHGYTMQGVSGGSSTAWKNYIYSVGLSAKTGHELVIVNHGQSGPSILETAATSSLKGTLIVDEVFVSDDFIVNGLPLRLIIKDIPLDSFTAQGCMGKIGTVTNIKQIFIADKNNILPGEEGYDVEFVQELSEVDV